ncbi:hypothetical protein GCM10027600_08060 [Nocardioides ginsengisegetis]
MAIGAISISAIRLADRHHSPEPEAAPSAPCSDTVAYMSGGHRRIRIFPQGLAAPEGERFSGARAVRVEAQGSCADQITFGLPTETRPSLAIDTKTFPLDSSGIVIQMSYPTCMLTRSSQARCYGGLAQVDYHVTN